MEDKALHLIQEQMAKQIEGFGTYLSGVVMSLFKKDN
jgi:hypothetical protein